MNKNTVTVKDILNVTPNTNMVFYKVVNKEEAPNSSSDFVFAFEGKAMCVPTAFYDLPVVELASGCEYEIDKPFIKIFFKEKTSTGDDTAEVVSL